MSAAPLTLLVEDSDDVLESYRGTFEADGLLLDTAETWEEGLGRFRVGGHRLVIVDYNLPGDRHGLRLIVEMKLLLPSTELILISGALSHPAEELARRISLVDHFYPKTPRLPDRLVEHARSALARAEQDTDWQKVGQEYLTPEDAVDTALAEIDEALRADVARRIRG